MTSEEIFARAVAFATEAHEGQVRKYTGEPYVTHPIAVAKIVATVEHTPEMLVAAILHDTVEDTSVTFKDIEREFGSKVRELVFYTTEISEKEDGNRAVRKEMDALHYAQGDWQAQTIKMADLLHNTASIKQHDENFWKTYQKEKARLLEVLVLADSRLREKAAKSIAQ